MITDAEVLRVRVGEREGEGEGEEEEEGRVKKTTREGKEGMNK